MIELKNYLDIPHGYYIEVGPVERGGYYSTSISQQITLYKEETYTEGLFRKRTLVRGVKIYHDYIFLTQDGCLKYDINLTFGDMRKKIREIMDGQREIKPLFRPGRHP